MALDMTNVDYLEFEKQGVTGEIETKAVDEVPKRVTAAVGELALKDVSEPTEAKLVSTRIRAAREVIESAERGSAPDIVKLYLGDIGPQPLLTKEDEVRLAKQIEAGREAAQKLEDKNLNIKPAEKRWLSNAVKLGEEATQEFIKSNLKLVANVAKWYPSEKVNYLDRVQDGNLGLMHAVEKFEWRKGFKFSTYATWWIRQAVIRGIAESGRIIRLPIGQSEALAAVFKAQRELSRTHGRQPTAQEIADFTYKSLDEVNKILMFETDAMSLDGALSPDSDTELVEIVSDQNARSLEDKALDSIAIDDARDILGVLSPEERQITELVNGFDGFGERSKSEVAKLLGRDKNQVTLIYNEAISKLRHPSSPITIDHRLKSLEVGWRDKAACLGVETRLFFPGRGEDTTQAKDVCDGCIVKDSCLETALNNNEKFGIWGGKSEKERRAIRRKIAVAKKMIKT